MDRCSRTRRKALQIPGAPGFGASYPLSITVRDAHTLTLIRNLTLDPLRTAREVPDLAHAEILIAPDGRAVYCAYRVFSVAHGFGGTYLARWSLPSGRLLIDQADRPRGSCSRRA